MWGTSSWLRTDLAGVDPRPPVYLSGLGPRLQTSGGVSTHSVQDICLPSCSVRTAVPVPATAHFLFCQSSALLAALIKLSVDLCFPIPLASLTLFFMLGFMLGFPSSSKNIRTQQNSVFCWVFQVILRTIVGFHPPPPGKSALC